MPIQTLALLAFSVLNLLIFYFAIRQSKAGNFYTDTPLLTLLGIFVWGDALVIAPFWALTALVGLWATPLQILRFILLFYAIRAAYEVIYWINHQVVHRDYIPPLVRRFAWLKANDAAILYQLLNMLQVIISLALLSLTF